MAKVTPDAQLEVAAQYLQEAAKRLIMMGKLDRMLSYDLSRVAEECLAVAKKMEVK